MVFEQLNNIAGKVKEAATLDFAKICEPQQPKGDGKNMAAGRVSENTADKILGDCKLLFLRDDSALATVLNLSDEKAEKLGDVIQAVKSGAAKNAEDKCVDRLSTALGVTGKDAKELLSIIKDLASGQENKSHLSDVKRLLNLDDNKATKVLNLIKEQMSQTESPQKGDQYSSAKKPGFHQLTKEEAQGIANELNRYREESQESRRYLDPKSPPEKQKQQLDSFEQEQQKQKELDKQKQQQQLDAFEQEQQKQKESDKQKQQQQLDAFEQEQQKQKELDKQKQQQQLDAFEQEQQKQKELDKEKQKELDPIEKEKLGLTKEKEMTFVTRERIGNEIKETPELTREQIDNITKEKPLELTKEQIDNILRSFEQARVHAPEATPEQIKKLQMDVAYKLVNNEKFRELSVADQLLASNLAHGIAAGGAAAIKALKDFYAEMQTRKDLGKINMESFDLEHMQKLGAFVTQALKDSGVVGVGLRINENGALLYVQGAEHGLTVTPGGRAAVVPMKFDGRTVKVMPADGEIVDPDPAKAADYIRNQMIDSRPRPIDLSSLLDRNWVPANADWLPGLRPKDPDSLPRVPEFRLPKDPPDVVKPFIRTVPEYRAPKEPDSIRPKLPPNWEDS